MIYFGSRVLNFAHYDFKMVNERFHTIIYFPFGRKVKIGDIGVKNAFGFFLQFFERLLNDAETLPYLLVPDDEPVVTIATGPYRYLKLKVLIRGIGFQHTGIIIQAGRPQ